MKGSNDIFLSIIVPAFQEEAKIADDVRAAARYLDERDFSGEIIVVDDGSDDQTTAVASGLRGEYPNLKVVSYKPNCGKGYALRQGVKESVGRYIMFADSGLCVPYDRADAGLDLVRNGSPVAIGSRRLKEAEIVRAQPAYRRFGSKVFWTIVNTWIRLPKGVTDTQCGFKVFDGEVGRTLYADCFTDGFMIDIEMLCRARQGGYAVKEFPVAWKNDPDSRYNPVSGTVQNFGQLWRIYRGVRKRT